MKPKIRILIVDDHAMIRYALAQSINYQKDLLLVGEASDGEEALKLYRKHRPDVVTMDYKLTGANGIKTTAAIRAEFPEARVLLISIYEGDEDIWRAVQAGAAGYVSKSVRTEEIISVIREIARGNSYFSAGLAEKIANRRPEENLTPREQSVLAQIVAGHSNKEIMTAMGMSGPAVKRRIENIYAKLHVIDRTQAATAAVQRGIVHLDEL
jgi:DNA-binding NarL/FixJ family response regulator